MVNYVRDPPVDRPQSYHTPIFFGRFLPEHRRDRAAISFPTPPCSRPGGSGSATRVMREVNATALPYPPAANPHPWGCVGFTRVKPAPCATEMTGNGGGATPILWARRPGHSDAVTSAATAPLRCSRDVTALSSSEFAAAKTNVLGRRNGRGEMDGRADSFRGVTDVSNAQAGALSDLRGSWRSI